VKIALAQINTKIADFTGNCEKMAAYSRKARDVGADIIVFPEFSVCGYPPLDLLAYNQFIDDSLYSVDSLCKELPPDIAVVVGYPAKHPGNTGKTLYNTAAVLYQGDVIHRQPKTLLPDYDVFDESRYFEPASSWEPFFFKGKNIALAICEDFWAQDTGELLHEYHVDPLAKQAENGADFIIGISSSPFYAGKLEQRINRLEDICRVHGVSAVYVNSVGGNDSLIFDGRSMAVSPKAGLQLLCASFKEEMAIWDTEGKSSRAGTPSEEPQEEELLQALTLGIKDYVGKTGFSKVHVGLSGGLDSALVAALAVDALGADKVCGFALPSRYSSEHSLEDARKLAENLAISCQELSVEPVFSSSLAALQESFQGREHDETEENIQARIRGLLLMAWSNKMNSLLLTTGNKSELAVGYCTLYGDMCGSMAVIGDVFKTQVFALSRYINKKAGWERIPERIITKPPSAELRPDQKDEDSLPPYDVLDGILERFLHRCLSPEEIINEGFDPETVMKITRLVTLSEYKRSQAPFPLKVSPKAFGLGRRIPLARNFYESSSSSDTASRSRSTR